MPALRFSIFLSFSLLLTPLFIPTVSFSQVQPAVESTYRGDINEDGQVNIFDLLEMLKLLSSEPETDRQRQIANVDKSADDNVNIFDLLAMLRLLGGEKPEEIFWGPAISGLSSLSAAVGDTVGINVINFGESITAGDVKAYIDATEASIFEFSQDSISIVIPDWFSGGDVSLIVSTDTTNSKYLNFQIKEQVQAANGGVVGHPDGASVDIPANALQADVAITVEVPTEEQLETMNIAADTGTTTVLFGPSGTGFTEPVTVALPWPNSATEADSLGAQYYDETEGAWKAIGTTGSDPGQRLAYVLTDHFTAFKSVKTQVVQIRVLTTSRWTRFNLVSGGAMSLHHLISASERATATEMRGDTIYLSQPTDQSVAGEIQPYAQEIVEMVVDVSFNVPDMSGELVFEIEKSRYWGPWTHVALANYLGAEPNNRENFWWGGFVPSDQPNAKSVKLNAVELFSQSPARVPPAVDPTTLDMKVLFGYQGWFGCSGDGSDPNYWFHWFKTSDQPVAENLSVDYWPDMSELSPEERFATEMTLPDGSPAEVYSNYIRKTTVRHFQWMEDYDLDGIFLQRFLGELASPQFFCFRNKVLQNVIAGAEAHGRVFAIEYDAIGRNFAGLKNDWIFLVDVLKVTESPNYLYHKGKPLLGSFGMKMRVADSLTQWLAEEADPRYKATLFDGVPPNLEEKMWTLDVFDVVSPWTVGKYKSASEVDYYKERYITSDIMETSARGVDYMPVVWPGFSWINLYHDYPFNDYPRNGGRYLWHQVHNAISAGAKMIFIAMFDEVDEGTAMFKLAPTAAELPVGAQLVPLDIDGYAVPSDWYLQLARETGRMLRGEIPLSAEMPLDLPSQE